MSGSGSGSGSGKKIVPVSFDSGWRPPQSWETVQRGGGNYHTQDVPTNVNIRNAGPKISPTYNEVLESGKKKKKGECKQQ